MWWTLALFILGAFFLGAIPFGLIVARLFAGVDLRKTGSGNIGATNVARTLGPIAGLLTLALDLAKGLGPVLLTRTAFPDPGLSLFPAVAGVTAILGHCYSPLLKFKGGKGVATALGVFLGLIPLTIGPAFAVFLLVVVRWKFISAGSLAASAAAPLFALALGYPPEAAGLAGLVTCIIFLRHRENIGRLWRGQEPRFQLGKKSGRGPS
jgi:glycerol-3-phosphate acyltransferase PlsY